jgi:hypothetical protein
VMRPLFRWFCKALGIQTVYAVAGAIERDGGFYGLACQYVATPWLHDANFGDMASGVASAANMDGHVTIGQFRRLGWRIWPIPVLMNPGEWQEVQHQ